MTAPGGGEPYRDQPGPWQQYQHPPVDPHAPVNYPEYPPTPPYAGQPPPSYGPIGYGGPPPYPGSYDPYQVYQDSSYHTNRLAIASLTTSIAGVPLSFVCLLGLPAAIVGVILGAVALTQVGKTNERGSGLAIAGIVIGSILTVLLLVLLALFGLMATAVVHAPVI